MMVFLKNYSTSTSAILLLLGQFYKTYFKPECKELFLDSMTGNYRFPKLVGSSREDGHLLFRALTFTDRFRCVAGADSQISITLKTLHGSNPGCNS